MLELAHPATTPAVMSAAELHTHNDFPTAPCPSTRIVVAHVNALSGAPGCAASSVSSHVQGLSPALQKEFTSVGQMPAS